MSDGAALGDVHRNYVATVDFLRKPLPAMEASKDVLVITRFREDDFRILDGSGATRAPDTEILIKNARGLISNVATALARNTTSDCIFVTPRQSRQEQTKGVFMIPVSSLSNRALCRKS